MDSQSAALLVPTHVSRHLTFSPPKSEKILTKTLDGLLPLLVLIFPIFASAYLVVLSLLSFPARAAPVASSETFNGGQLFHLYVMPQLFLLSFQILTENIIGSMSLFSPPVRAFVPVLYTVGRIFVIIHWMADLWFNKDLPPNLPLKVLPTYKSPSPGSKITDAMQSYLNIICTC
ncbi:hypothetical protein SAY87_013074 [Trapa incisa]|uniref:DUF7733 domain-containing protein n=1 Tax=Trapa incisa TaxID=236973 RepID=A0AAN7QCD7_9MYRT|nr:hypothetical protein SAY87_013074 [Trapa incisa]